MDKQFAFNPASNETSFELRANEYEAFIKPSDSPDCAACGRAGLVCDRGDFRL